MASPQRTKKAERRAAARTAVARASAARRQGNMITAAVVGLVALGIIVAAVVIFRGADSTGSADATASGEPSATSSTPFPALPEGADPALASRPEVSAGTGELSALKVTPLIEGSGAATAAGQTITVNYVGVRYETGEAFDASWDRSEPFSFPLGAGQVIQGWDQGLVGVKVGSRVQLDIPSSLAYGDNPDSGAPAGPLRFVVDVLAAQ